MATTMTIRLLILTVVLTCRLCFADIYVVANKDNPVNQLSVNEVRDLYLGRSKAFPDGQFAYIYDREESSEARARFFRAIANMDLSQVDAYWARLVFAGRMLPLNTASTDNILVKKIGIKVNAIGYLTHAPSSPDVKTLLVIHEQP